MHRPTTHANQSTVLADFRFRPPGHPLHTVRNHCQLHPIHTWRNVLSSTIDAVRCNGRRMHASFPKITPALVRKYPPRAVAIAQGHLDQQKMNIRPTTPWTTTPAPPTSTTLPPIANTTNQLPNPPGARTHTVYAQCVSAAGQVFTDQTGRFPHRSTARNTDILVLYCFDANYIHVEAMPSRTSYQILLSYQRAHKMLVARGLRPSLLHLDNKASAALIAYLDREQVDYQLTPAGIHHRNSAEHAISTWKNHFLALLGSLNPNFPMKLWDKLIPHQIFSSHMY